MLLTLPMSRRPTVVGRASIVAVALAAALLMPVAPAHAATETVHLWTLARPDVSRSGEEVVLRHFNTQSCSREQGDEGAQGCHVPDYDLRYELNGVVLGTTHYVRGSGMNYGVADVSTTAIAAGSHLIDVIVDPTAPPHFVDGVLVDTSLPPYLDDRVGVTVLDPDPGGDRLDNLYRFLLGRPIDPSGAAFFAGRPTAEVVSALLGSRERHEWFVAQILYPRLLRRFGDIDGVRFFAALLASGVDERSVVGSMMASEEYRSARASRDALHGEEMFSAMYFDLLGRAPDDYAYWRSVGLNGAGAMAHSDEAAERLVEQSYALYLDRAPVASETAYWANVLRSRTPDALRLGIVASPEYTSHWG